jgi:hypothetical protein
MLPESPRPRLADNDKIYILNKWDMTVWIGFVWLRIMTTGRLF